MKVIHLVRSIIKINFGVWNAAIFGTESLEKEHGVKSEMWICNFHEDQTPPTSIDYFYFEDKHKTKSGFSEWLDNYNAKDTVIISHGSWFVTTKMGFWASKLGYSWIYTPHGMLEPWTFKIKRFQKLIYFPLFEKRYVKEAGLIRAVSEKESKNLNKLFPQSRIEIVSNGAKMPSGTSKEKRKLISYIFMARLNPVKNVVNLAEAWHKTMKDKNVELLIAGPDEGELEKMQQYIGGNLKYLGPVYGEEKKKLLSSAHYYFLPSSNEGLPGSVVEAMSYGLIPIITEACNLKDVFKYDLGYKIDSSTESMMQVLDQLYSLDYDESKSKRNIAYVKDNLSEVVISKKLLKIYKELIDS